jgi:putative transcriptional regulator
MRRISDVYPAPHAPVKLEPSLRGQLLLGSPSLVDPNFRRAVVLVGEHDEEEGALGVILNRPTGVTVAEAAPALAVLVPEEELVYAGGPVRPESVLVLAEVEDAAVVDGFVVGGVGFLRGDADFDELPAVLRRARVFAGYAGWSAGQLEAEIESDDWMLVDARPEDAFAPDSVDLWAEAVRRKGGPYRLVATMPDDPTLN